MTEFLWTTVISRLAAGYGRKAAQAHSLHHEADTRHHSSGNYASTGLAPPRSILYNRAAILYVVIMTHKPGVPKRDLPNLSSIRANSISWGYLPNLKTQDYFRPPTIHPYDLEVSPVHMTAFSDEAWMAINLSICFDSNIPFPNLPLGVMERIDTSASNNTQEPFQTGWQNFWPQSTPWQWYIAVHIIWVYEVYGSTGIRYLKYT